MFAYPGRLTQVDEPSISETLGPFGHDTRKNVGVTVNFQHGEIVARGATELQEVRPVHTLPSHSLETRRKSSRFTGWMRHPSHRLRGCGYFIMKQGDHRHARMHNAVHLGIGLQPGFHVVRFVQSLCKQGLKCVI